MWGSEFAYNAYNVCVICEVVGRYGGYGGFLEGGVTVSRVGATNLPKYY